VPDLLEHCRYSPSPSRRESPRRISMPRDPGGIDRLGIGILYHGSKLLSRRIAFFFLTQKLLSGILSPVLGYCCLQSQSGVSR
jgi:hypothetical protein